jgi:hypothetical protein
MLASWAMAYSCKVTICCLHPVLGHLAMVLSMLFTGIGWACLTLTSRAYLCYFACSVSRNRRCYDTLGGTSLVGGGWDLPPLPCVSSLLTDVKPWTLALYSSLWTHIILVVNSLCIQTWVRLFINCWLQFYWYQDDIVNMQHSKRTKNATFWFFPAFNSIADSKALSIVLVIIFWNRWSSCIVH